MKLFYVLLVLSLVFPGLSHAQYLAESNRTTTPLLTREVAGSANPQWEKEQDQINGHISSGKLSNMKMVTEAIVAFLHDSCISDERYTPIWHGEYFSEKTSAAAQIKFGVHCNFYEQKAKLTILANDISPLLDHLVVNNQNFLTIQPAAAVKNDYTWFTPTLPNAEETKPLRSKIWLVTADNHQLL